MRISGAVEDRLAEAGIRLIAKPTREACEEFNNLSRSQETAFAAHLTC
jgi:hypothetical protein